MDEKAAEVVAARELIALPSRLAHVRAVGGLARSVSHLAPEVERPVLVAAAYLHDIGYAPGIASTGFHPLDGARWLLDHGEMRLANLVAHHTGALHEARNRGLDEDLAVFPREQSLVADLLTWCDLSRGPDGTPVAPLDRIAEVVERYGPDHVVSRSITSARPELLRTCGRVSELLRLSEVRASVGERNVDAQSN